MREVLERAEAGDPDARREWERLRRKYVYEEGQLSVLLPLSGEVVHDESLTFEQRRRQLSFLASRGDDQTRAQASGYLEMLSMMETAEDEILDDAFAAAARVAAAMVPTGDSGYPLERELEEALLPPLRRALDGCVVRPRSNLDTPTWDPQPRGVDVVVFKKEKPWAAAELKIFSSCWRLNRHFVRRT